jgi:hypothetical protein
MLGELTEQEVEDILKANVIGRIGCCSQQKMYVVPVTYYYDGDFVYGHTVEGMKTKILRNNPECCFEVDVMKDMTNWKSVIAWGTYEELKNEEAANVMEKLINKLAPLMPSETSHPPRMGPAPTVRTSTFAKDPIIYRIKLKEKTGRFERH